MPNTASRPHPPDLAVSRLATCTQLDAQHARLRARGVHATAEGWVVARPDDLAQAGGLQELSVAPTQARIGAAAARRLQRQMARFSDGPEHEHRRRLAKQLLPPAAGLQDAAAQLTTTLLRTATGSFDVMPTARTVPVIVLADVLGVPADDLPAVAEATGQLCDALAPALAPPLGTGEADAAATRLSGLLAPAGPWPDPEHEAAAAGLLFQARDATAALIGAALLAASPDVEPSTRVELALRRDAPVQCTRRTATDNVPLGGATIPRGALVWLVLAAGEQGAPGPPATFGTGLHACPGAAQARALAGGVLDGLAASGWQVLPGQHVQHEPRPNLRVPATLLVKRA